MLHAQSHHQDSKAHIGDGFARDSKVLISQHSVAHTKEIAKTGSVCFISAGELTRNSLLCRQNILSKSELESLHSAGAIGGRYGQQVDHEMNQSYHRSWSI
ncbi:hypothetical protein M8994_14255 [Brucella sp. 21LCYQ03]|nr:hypothetical protein [Brucella sp. 21LCYQ03]